MMAKAPVQDRIVWDSLRILEFRFAKWRMVLRDKIVTSAKPEVVIPMPKATHTMAHKPGPRIPTIMAKESMMAAPGQGIIPVIKPVIIRFFIPASVADTVSDWDRPALNSVPARQARKKPRTINKE